MRPVETRPEGPRAGVGVLGEEQRDSPHQLGSPGQSPGKFGFWSILGPQKSRQNGQLAFESGATSETCPPPPTQRMDRL